MLTTVGNRFRQPGEDSADGPTGIIGRAVTARDEEAEQTDGRPVARPGAADILTRAARAVRRGLAVTVAPQSTRAAARDGGTVGRSGRSSGRRGRWRRRPPRTDPLTATPTTPNDEESRLNTKWIVLGFVGGWLCCGGCRGGVVSMVAVFGGGG